MALKEQMVPEEDSKKPHNLLTSNNFVSSKKVLYPDCTQKICRCPGSSTKRLRIIVFAAQILQWCSSFWKVFLQAAGGFVVSFELYFLDHFENIDGPNLRGTLRTERRIRETE